MSKLYDVAWGWKGLLYTDILTSTARQEAHRGDSTVTFYSCSYSPYLFGTDREARVWVVCGIGTTLASRVTLSAFVADMLKFTPLTWFACVKGPASPFGKKLLRLLHGLWLRALLSWLATKTNIFQYEQTLWRCMRLKRPLIYRYFNIYCPARGT